MTITVIESDGTTHAVSVDDSDAVALADVADELHERFPAESLEGARWEVIA